MTYDKDYGVVAKEKGYAPAPSFILRRQRILELLPSFKPGKVIEVGCGAGAILYDLCRRGFHCTALETSDRAREIAAYINRENAATFELCSAADPDWAGRFNYVCSFEVLEHIENDEAALRTWASWLSERGHLFLSVPAHARRWGADDEAVGHFRRYEREDLEAKLARAGFQIVHYEHWGYPLSNLMRPLRIRKYRTIIDADTGKLLGRTQRTALSGVERSAEARFLRILQNPFGRVMMRCCFLLQRLFSRTELSDGILLIARKIGTPGDGPHGTTAT